MYYIYAESWFLLLSVSDLFLLLLLSLSPPVLAHHDHVMELELKTHHGKRKKGKRKNMELAPPPPSVLKQKNKIVRLLPGLQPFFCGGERWWTAVCRSLKKKIFFGVFHITRITTHPIIYLYAEAFSEFCRWPSVFFFFFFCVTLQHPSLIQF